jgi:hypothetical protein
MLQGMTSAIRIGAAVVVVAAPTMTAAGQIVVGPNVQVSRARSGDPHYEVLAAADPRNPSRLLVGAIHMPPSGPAGTIAYVSNDGGETWTPTLETPPRDRVSDASSDPALTYSSDGTALFLSSLLPPNSAGPTRRMLLYRSSDGGQTWEPPVYFTYSDREYVVVDGSGGPNHGRIYVSGNSRVGGTAGSLTFFYSLDGGKTFTESRVPKVSTSAMVGNSVVLSDGTIVGLDVTLRPDVEQKPGDMQVWMRATRSTDGGRSFGSPIAVTAANVVAGRKGAHNNTEHLPMMTADGSTGRFKDRLYVVWPDYRAGHTDIFICSSRDGGKTWSSPRRVNDAPEPRDQAEAVDHFMPNVAVNREGVLGVIWYDRRNRRDNMGWEVRFTASEDGGETFLPSVLVSEHGSVFGAGERWIAHSQAAKTPKNDISLDIALDTFTFLGGDTAGLTADAAGRFHVVWVDNSTGTPQIWTAPVAVTRRGAQPTTARAAEAGNGASGLQDVTGSITVDSDEPAYDRTRDQVTVRLRLLNHSNRALKGPFTIRVRTLESELGDPRVVDADRGGSGVGAEWDVVIAADGLQPGERTPRRTLAFHLENLQPFREGDRYRRGLVKMSLAVLAPAAGTSVQR